MRSKLSWLVPLAALLRRDLRGGRRGAATATARALSILVASAAVLVAYAAFTPGVNEEMAVAQSLGIFASLMGLAHVLAPAIAIAALRGEREAGTLDLLLLAGIRVPTLVVGRTLSSFALLANLLLAALPAIAFLAFFRAPPIGGLLVAALVLLAHFLAVAAVAVALSAWGRSAGMTITVSFLVFGGWAALLVLGVDDGLPLASTALLDALDAGVIDWSAVAGAAPPALMASVGVNLVLTVLAGAVAVVFLREHRETTSRDRLRETLERRARARGRSLVRPVDPRWPLTWLARRTSAPEHPAVQAVLVVPIVVVSLAAGVETSATIGGGLLLVACLVGLGIGATGVTREREQRTWESLLTTRLDAGSILHDLVRRAASGSAVFLVGGLVLVASAQARFHLAASGAFGAMFERSDFMLIQLAVLAVLASWASTIAAAVGGSIAARTTGGALGIALGFVVAEPIVGIACGQALRGASRFGDAAGTVTWLLLLADAAFLAVWLIVRARWRRPIALLAAFLPTVLMLLLPYLLLDDARPYALAPLVIGVGAGVALLIFGLQRLRGGMAMGGALLLLSFGVLPVVVDGMELRDEIFWFFPWITWPIVAMKAVSGQHAGFDASDIGASLLHSLLVLGTLVAVLVPRRERWLGRAG